MEVPRYLGSPVRSPMRDAGVFHKDTSQHTAPQFLGCQVCHFVCTNTVTSKAVTHLIVHSLIYYSCVQIQRYGLIPMLPFDS